MAAAWVQTVTPWTAAGVTTAPSGSFTPTASNAVTVFGVTSLVENISVTGTGSYNVLTPPGQFNDSNGDDHVLATNLSATGGSQTVTLGGVGTSQTFWGWAWEYSGVNSNTGSSAQLFTNPGNNTAFGTTGVTVDSSSVLLAMCVSVNGTATVPTVSGPAGSVDRGNGTLGGVAYRIVEWSGSGSTITPQFQSTTGGSSTYVVHILLLQGVAGPTINTQPTNQSCYSGQTASFSVSATASAGSLTYQWQFSHDDSAFANCTNGTGPTTSSFTTATTPDSQAANGYSFQCAVTDTNGTVNTNAALLTVNTVANAAWITA